MFFGAHYCKVFESQAAAQSFLLQCKLMHSIKEREKGWIYFLDKIKKNKIKNKPTRSHGAEYVGTETTYKTCLIVSR